MAQFKEFSSGVEVKGEAVLSLLDGMNVFKSQALSILEKNGISDVKPGKWYSQKSWLNAFKSITESIGPNTLFNIGLKIPENAVFPPDIDTIEKALSSIDIAYYMNHRGGEIGHYVFQKTGERSGKMVCANPYPCDFDMGIITAVAKKFKPASSAIAKVTHDTAAPCRNKKGDSCTYIIQW